MRLVRIAVMLCKVAGGVFVVALAWPFAVGQIPAPVEHRIGVQILLCMLPISMTVEMLRDFRKTRSLSAAAETTPGWPPPPSAPGGL
jgi:hypothetical protein